MIVSIELQVISRILTSEDKTEIDELCSYDKSYYSLFQPHIEFILDHYNKYHEAPDVFTFQAAFPEVNLVSVSEPIEFLISELKKNKQHILLVQTFNTLKDLGSDDVEAAWQYLSKQCDKVSELDDAQPLDIVKDAKKRIEQVAQFSKQSRIPTGFDEIDKIMYGGLSTVEELLLIVARTNTGKSWVCTKMMESAQKNGFPVAYYSPEMQASYLGTRFDTWRSHFENSKLYQGKYSDEYLNYIDTLSSQSTSAYIIENKDMADDEVRVSNLKNFVRKHGIKLLIIDGLSYMTDDKKSDRDYEKYKNIAGDLFKLSKELSCAVVVALQANRETKELKDDKGPAMPSLYEIEGSDHPGRICTQAFSLRQVFDKHVLDIRLEKSRMANNQKPIFSYSWDVNTGNMQYIPSDANSEELNKSISISAGPITSSFSPPDSTESKFADVEDEIEF